MIENLKRVREPLTWAAIVLTLAGIGLTGWRLVMGMLGGEMSIFQAFQEAGTGWLNLSIALLLVVLALSCSLVPPAVRRARLVAIVAAWVLTVGVVLTLISAVMGMWASAIGVGVVLDALGGLLDVAFKALTAGAIWVFLRGVKAGRIETAAVGTVAPVAAEEPPAAEPAEEQAPSASPRDAAAGSVWWTAADAAAGAPSKDRMPDSAESEPTP